MAKVPLLRAGLFISLSTLVISGGALTFLVAKSVWEKKRTTNPAYTVEAVLQKTTRAAQLPTSLLIELLNLSKDRPVNLYAFPLKKATEHLMSQQVFKWVQLKRYPPATLFVEYALRDPWFYLSDFENTVVDVTGIIMPFHPFFTPKKIPSVRLGKFLKWGDQLYVEDLEEVKNVLSHLQSLVADTSVHVERIDLSDVFNEQSPLREIRVLLKTGDRERWLRLTRDELLQQLTFFSHIQETLLEWEKQHPNQKTVIDLRVSDIAYLAEER